MQITGNFTNFYGANMLPAINTMFMNRYKQYPPVYNKVFQVESSNRSIEQITHVTGVGLFRPVAEGAALTYDRPEQGYTKTFTHSDFALGILVTRQMIRDDKWQLIRKQVDALVRSNRESIEIQAADIFNGGFGTITVPSGQYLFSASHPRVKAGGTRSNLVTSTDLNMTSLQAAMTVFDGFTDDAGILNQIPYSTLMVPKELRFKAAKLLKSADDPETANRSTNTLKYGQDGMPDMLVNRYLTDTDAWFLMAKPEDTGLYWFWREKPYTDYWTDNQTRNATHAMWYACSYGAANPDGVVGTSGT